MVHFSTYARPCVHPMTCASQMAEECARCVFKKTFIERQHHKKWKLDETLRLNRYEKPFSPFFCTENFVIYLEQNLFFRNHLLYFHYVIKELVHAYSCAYIELWMHLGSLESTQEASNSYASLVLSKLSRAHPYFDIRTLGMNQFLNSRTSWVERTKARLMRVRIAR